MSAYQLKKLVNLYQANKAEVQAIKDAQADGVKPDPRRMRLLRKSIKAADKLARELRLKGLKV